MYRYSPPSILIRVLASFMAFGVVIAMAASLGGITSSNLGADNTTVASCDTNGVTANYTVAWDATDARYEVTTVTVGGVSDTCDGQTMSVTLTNASNAQIGVGTLSIPVSGATSFGVSLTTAASAKDTTGIHIAIGS